MKYEVIHSCITSQEEMNRLEAKEIIDRNTLAPNGYNLKISGQGGIFSDETKRKQSERLTGRKISRDVVERMAQAHRGLKRNEETRKKMSMSQRGKGHPNPNLNKPVRCIDTGEEFISITSACLHYGLNPNGMTKALRDSSKSYRGKQWERIYNV